MIANGRHRRSIYLLLALLSLAAHLPVMYRAIYRHTDFQAHITYALAFPHELNGISNVLFHADFLFFHTILGLPQQLAVLIAILLVMVPVPLIAFALFKRSAGEKVSEAVLMALSLGLAVIAPITIWTDQLMLGYLNPIVYHNPTSITARLFVIPVSILAFRCFRSLPYRSLNNRIYILLLCAVLMVLSILAKPSFALALVPGCLLFAIWHVIRRRHVDWLLLTVGVLVPASLTVGMQTIISYRDFDDGSFVAVGFLTFMKLWIPTWRIPIQLLLSVVFPLGIGLLYVKQARRHLLLTFAWTVFICSILVSYFLYESGPRMRHGNFLWTSYNAVFLLMFVSILFLVEQYVRELRHGEGRLQLFSLRFSRRFALASFLLGLHVLSGIAYYYRSILNF